MVKRKALETSHVKPEIPHRYHMVPHICLVPEIPHRYPITVRNTTQIPHGYPITAGNITRIPNYC